MNNEKSDFLSPAHLMIIVEKLTEDVIKMAIGAYVKDEAYYLKLYATALDTKTLDVLKERHTTRDKLLAALLDKGESIDFEDYNLINFDINKYPNL